MAKRRQTFERAARKRKAARRARAAAKQQKRESATKVEGEGARSA